MAIPGAEPDLPLWQQVAFNFGAFIAVGMAAFVGYFRRPAQPTIEAQVVGGALADRTAMMDLATAIRDHAHHGDIQDNVESIAASLRRVVEELEEMNRRQGRQAAENANYRRTDG